MVIILCIPMRKIISFCIYGDNLKYTRGLYENLLLIQQNLPDYHAVIYEGNNVPSEWIEKYKQFLFVQHIKTESIGHDNMIDRFYAVDLEDAEIVFIRDADSRIHSRDLFTIKHFEQSKHTFHTTRDHPEHGAPILGGLWGIKKGAVTQSIHDLYLSFNPLQQQVNAVQHDQMFLRNILYPLIQNNIIVYVYNDRMKMFQNETIKRIPFPVINNEFCGAVVTFEGDGPVDVYNWEPSWNYETKVICLTISEPPTDDESVLPSTLFAFPVIGNTFRYLRSMTNKERYNIHLYIDLTNRLTTLCKTFFEQGIDNCFVYDKNELETNTILFGYSNTVEHRI
jgi:hypothetical protein